MTTRVATGPRNTAVDAVAALADGGTIEIRSGSQPASANDSASGTLLATVALAATAFGDSANGVASLAGVPLSGTGVAAGTAGWFRIKSSGGSTVLDGSVGTSGTELIINTTTISVGLTVIVTSGTMTLPES